MFSIIFYPKQKRFDRFLFSNGFIVFLSDSVDRVFQTFFDVRIILKASDELGKAFVSKGKQNVVHEGDRGCCAFDIGEDIANQRRLLVT